MKKVLAISSVLFGIVFLAGCGQQSVSQIQPTTPASVMQTPLSSHAIVTEEVIYTNVQYGFQLAFPSGWENYNIATRKTGTKNFINVSLPPSVYTSLFAIIIEDISDWQKKCQMARKDNEPITIENTGPEFNDCTDNPPTEPAGTKKLEMNDKYVFSINVNQNIRDEARVFICGSSNCDYDKFAKIIIDMISKGFNLKPEIIEPVDKNMNWQTYQDKKSGYKINYPRNWYLYTRNNGSYVNFQDFVEPLEGGYSGIGGTGCQVSISISPNQNFSNINDLIDERKSHIIDEVTNEVIKTVSKEIIIDGIKGLEVTYLGNSYGANRPSDIIFYKNNIYEIEKNCSNVFEKNYTAIMDKIISTIKFTE
jgi:hypothetical protein